jgi:flavin reductase (DIM6/NTAB) family NADH-FMN oxidoreductase RutF
MPVVSMMSLSDNPPLVGVSCGLSHSTTKTIIKAKRFSVSWLDLSHVPEMERMVAIPGSKTTDKLKAAGLHHHRGRALQTPVIDEATAYLECAVVDRYTLGDHELIVGVVREAKATADFRDYWTFSDYRPILYVGSPDRFRVYEPGRSRD